LLELVGDLTLTASANFENFDIANSHLDPDAQGFALELRSLNRDLAERQKLLLGDRTLMEEYGAVSVVHPESVCLRKGCPAATDSLLAEIRQAELVATVESGLAGLGQQISISTEVVTETIEQLGEQVTSQIGDLADLVVDTTTLLSKQVADSFGELSDNFADKAAAEKQLASDTLRDKREQFLAAALAIKADHEEAEQRLKNLKEYSNMLIPITKTFYECKKDQELAELARKRVTAVFDIIGGAFEVGIYYRKA